MWDSAEDKNIVETFSSRVDEKFRPKLEEVKQNQIKEKTFLSQYHSNSMK